MRKLILPVALIVGSISIISILLNSKYRINKFLPEKKFSFLKTKIIKNVPFKNNEKMNFEMFLFGVKFGKSDLIFRGETKLNADTVYLIESNSDTLSYKGKELIYVSRKDFLPIRVKRDLVFMGNREMIVEDYDAESNSVTIKKTVGKDIKITKIRKDDDIQNSISLIYLFRTLDNFKKDILIDVNLPTREFKLKVKKDQKVAVPMGVFESFLFEDEGSNFRIWIGKDKNRLPLRFDYNSGLKRYSMRLTSYVNN
jgi:hypothetical protein